MSTLGQFGSFQNMDVEALVRLPEADFRAYLETQRLSSRSDDKLQRQWEREEALFSTPPPPFGKGIRGQFMLDLDRWTFLNHGAFGAVSRRLPNSQRKTTACPAAASALTPLLLLVQFPFFILKKNRSFRLCGAPR
jgi:hypothetical protein